MSPVKPIEGENYPDGGLGKPTEDTEQAVSGIQDPMQQHLADLVDSAAKTARYGSHPITGYQSNPIPGYTPKANDQK